MTDRDALRTGFLAASGWERAAIAALAGDASARRYHRLVRPDGARAVLMDAPEERGEDVRPFLGIAFWLRAQGLSAPEVLAADPGAGFLLIEDLGDDLYARHVRADPASEHLLYATATDLLASLARIPPPAALTVPGGTHRPGAYDAAALVAKARLALEWYVAGASDAPVSPALVAEFDAHVALACRTHAAATPCLALRDYHAENLFWLPGRAGLARVGLIDFQDAQACHPAYDLVSLLEDARRDTDPELRRAMIARHVAATGAEPGAFGAAYAVLGAQRNLRILGIFARLALRDRKPAYLALIPRVWSHIQTDLSHPALAPLAAFVARHVPPPEPGLIARLRARAP